MNEASQLVVRLLIAILAVATIICLSAAYGFRLFGTMFQSFLEVQQRSPYAGAVVIIIFAATVVAIVCLLVAVTMREYFNSIKRLHEQAQKSR
jgi:hypothetical protein